MKRSKARTSANWRKTNPPKMTKGNDGFAKISSLPKTGGKAVKSKIIAGGIQGKKKKK